jgi:hypothetical protein
VKLEYDSAIVSLSLGDVRELLKKKRTKEEFQGGEMHRYISEALNNINVDRDYLFKSNEYLSSGGMIEQYVLRALVSKGKSKVYNKSTKKYVDKIKMTHYISSMAGERSEGYEFAFMNGTVFLIDRISI